MLRKFCIWLYLTCVLVTGWPCILCISGPVGVCKLIFDIIFYDEDIQTSYCFTFGPHWSGWLPDKTNTVDYCESFKLRTCSWGNLRETAACSSHTVFPHTIIIEIQEFKWLCLFQRVIVLNEEEDAEGRKVANSVQVKVRNTYFPSLWYTASIILQCMYSSVQNLRFSFLLDFHHSFSSSCSLESGNTVFLHVF